MKNEYGFNVHYFKGKLERVLQGVDRYTPDEFAREMARMSVTADEKVLREPEFSTSTEAQYAELFTEISQVSPVMVRVSKDTLLRVPVYPAVEIDAIIAKAKAVQT